MPNEARLLRAQYASIITQYCYAQWSTVTENTVCFHHDTVLLCPVKYFYWEYSMLSSWRSIVMPNEALVLRTQYASIITQYCYAQWSTVIESTVCFHHDTVLLCPMKHCYWEHSMLSWWCSILCQMKHCYWERSMPSTWHSIVMPCEVLLLRAQYAFIMIQYCYAQWSSVTESTECFHLDTVLLCPMKHCYWEHSMLSSWRSIVMPNGALLLRTQYAFIMAQYFVPNEALLLKTQYAFNMTQYCYALWSAFTVSTVCFYHDTALLCPMKHCYWEHSMLSSWHSIDMSNEVPFLRTQYAFIMTQYCYAQWSTVTENTVCFHYDTGIVFPMKHCYWEHSMLPSWHSIIISCEVL